MNGKLESKPLLTIKTSHLPPETYGAVGDADKSKRKKNIFWKLTKRKRRDEKCESNQNKKPMLILTFALCLIMIIGGGSVKMK